MLRIDVDHTLGRQAVCNSGDQPIRRPGRRTPRDLRLRAAQPVQLQLRQADRRPVDRRRRPGPVGGGGSGHGGERRRPRASTTAGASWRATTATSPSTGCNTAGLTLPLAEYAHGAGDSIGCAIIGGYVYRGTAHPELVRPLLLRRRMQRPHLGRTAAGPATQTPQLLLSSRRQHRRLGPGRERRTLPGGFERDAVPAGLTAGGLTDGRRSWPAATPAGGPAGGRTRLSGPGRAPTAATAGSRSSCRSRRRSCRSARSAPEGPHCGAAVRRSC